MQEQQAPAKKKKKIKVTRVVNGIDTEVEIEVDEDSGPVWGPNDKHVLLNHHLKRVDGPLKVTGVAQYTFDKRLPEMLYGRVLRSPHPKAEVLKIDASAARQLAGVKAVVTILDGPPSDKPKMVNYAGEPVAAVAAVTPEVAEDAIRAIKVEYKWLPHVVSADEALKEGAPKVFPEGNLEPRDKRGDLAKTEAALKQSEIVLEAEYRTPIIHHSSLETHGNVVDYRGDNAATV